MSLASRVAKIEQQRGGIVDRHALRRIVAGEAIAANAATRAAAARMRAFALAALDAVQGSPFAIITSTPAGDGRDDLRE